MNKLILKVIIAGGQGAIGTSITNGLLRSTTTAFNITILTRHPPLSTPSVTPPHSLSYAKVDYTDLPSLTTLFTGAYAVISAIHQIQAVPLDPILLSAAIAAKVPRFFPYDYDCDRSHPHVRDTAGDVYGEHFAFMKMLEQAGDEGEISWTVVVPSEFLDYDAMAWLGFEVERREATLYDGGKEKATGCTPEFFGDCFAAVVADTGEEVRNRRIAVAEVAYNGVEMVEVLERVMGKRWLAVEDVSSEESFRRAAEALAAGDMRKAFLTHVLRLNYDGVGPANLVEGLKFMRGRIRRRSLEEIVRGIVEAH